MKTKLPDAFWQLTSLNSSKLLKVLNTSLSGSGWTGKLRTGLWGALLVLMTTHITQAQWTPVGNPVAGDVAAALAGSSVALSADGQTMAVGAPGTNAGRGQVKIYKIVNGAWTQQGNTISGDAVGNQAGASVALSSDGLTVAVGAPGSIITSVGQARVYKLTDGTWTQQGGTITGEVGNRVGSSVDLSLDGLTVAVGAPGASLGRGQVRIYKLTNGAWAQQDGGITGDGIGSQAGSSVALSADGLTVAVGAPGSTALALGQARIYKLTNGTWSQQDGAIIGEAGNRAGTSVDLSSDGLTVAVGSPGVSLGRGQVKVYKLTGGVWTQQDGAITGDAAGNLVGSSVALSSDGLTVAVGAPGTNLGRGQVRIYNMVNNVWTLQGSALSGDTAGDLAGSSVALSANGKIVALGATQLNLNVLTGLVKVFQFCDLTASISPLSISICAGSSTTLTASGGDSYAWSSNQSGASITVSPTVTTPYIVTATSGVCSATATATVFVKPLPDAGFTGLASSYCASDAAVTLTATTLGGTFSGSGVSGNIFTPANAGQGGTITYSVTVDGCTNTSSQNVTVKPLPVATLINNGSITDSNPTVTLTAGGGTTYAFSAGASQQGGASGTIATVNAPGPYSVTVTQNGCTATASTTVTGATSQSSCRNGSGVINVVVSGTPVKFEWYRNSTNSARLVENPAQVRGTSTASLTLVNQQVTANYFVRVTDANNSVVVYGPFKFTVNLGCNIYARQGAEEFNLQIQLLGNPLIGNQLRANVIGAAGKALTVQLVDLSGRPIRSQQWGQAESNQLVDWNLAQQASGVYLLQAATEATDAVPAQRYQTKLIKP